MESSFLFSKLLIFLDYFLYVINFLEDIIWSYIGTPLILTVGSVLTLKNFFPQIRKFPAILKFFFHSLFTKEEYERGVSPLQAFFTSSGGCIGVGNRVAVCLAIQLGGPGALFWLWIAAFFGMVIKYYEVYLGVKFRVPNEEGGFNGGPMYYLQRIFKSSFVPIFSCVLLCFYATEIYMFNVVKTSIVQNWNLNEYLVIALLLLAIFYAITGGPARVGKISSLVIPLFLVLYVGMCGWILICNAEKLVPMLILIMKSAFNPQAVLVGGFSGTLMTTMSQGITRGCYSGDIGIGYASIIGAEASAKDPSEQALLSIFGIFIDSFVVCTSTALLVIITGVWSQPIIASQMVQMALGEYFGAEAMIFFMPIFIFLLGYSTIISFLSAGVKSAQFIFPRFGKRIYFVFSTVAFIAFSFIDQSSALSIMSIVGGILLMINLYAILKLRKEVKF